MFTGVITHLGTCAQRFSESIRLDCSKDFLGELVLGSSVAVNGVCLTVSSLDKLGFEVQVIAETWQRTSLGELKVGEPVNLELPLGVNGRYEGHIVQGHVDGIGTVGVIKKEGNSHLFSVTVSPDMTRYMIAKGSIAMNGIALTLITVTDKGFTVGIIPYTYSHTMLSTAAVGDQVNIEVDIMAKYFMKFIKEQTYEKH